MVETLRTAWFGRAFGGEGWSGPPLPPLGLLDTWPHAAPALLVSAAGTAAAVMLTRRLFRREPRHA
ncbi:hypothetical protein ACWDRR_28715 [Kitasatospora sp. NPDC003701]